MRCKGLLPGDRPYIERWCTSSTDQSGVNVLAVQHTAVLNGSSCMNAHQTAKAAKLQSVEAYN